MNYICLSYIAGRNKEIRKELAETENRKRIS